MALKLPINTFSWQSTLTRWASELRSQFFLSKADFETPKTWEPVFTAQGAMTVGAVQIDGANYQRVGDFVWFSLRVPYFTLGGVASTLIYVSPPVQPDVDPSNLSNDATFAARVIDPGVAGTISGYGAIAPTGNFEVGKYTGANWALGAGGAIVMSGIYKALS